MSAYQPAQGTYPGMPPCENCGANFHLHQLAFGPWGPTPHGNPCDHYAAGTYASDEDAQGQRCPRCGAMRRRLGRPASGAEMRRAYDFGQPLQCPGREPERTDDLDEARAALERATAGGDEAAVFVARGTLQRLVRRLEREHAYDSIEGVRPPDPREHWPVDFEEGEA